MLTQTTYLKNLQHSGLKCYYLPGKLASYWLQYSKIRQQAELCKFKCTYNYIYNANVILNNYEEESYNSYR